MADDADMCVADDADTYMYVYNTHTRHPASTASFTVSLCTAEKLLPGSTLHAGIGVMQRHMCDAKAEETQSRPVKHAALVSDSLRGEDLGSRNSRLSPCTT